MFSRVGRVAGGAVVLIAAALTIQEFVAIDSRSHSVSDTLINWVPISIAIWLVASVALVVLAKALGARDARLSDIRSDRAD